MSWSGSVIGAFEQHDVRLVRRHERGCSIVTLVFEDSNDGASIAGEGVVSGMFNFLCGSDVALWRSSIPGCEVLTYRDIYPGVDAAFSWATSGLQYSLTVARGADLGKCRIRFEGGSDPSIQPDGAIAVSTPTGVLRQVAPEAWQETAAGRVSVAAVAEVVNDSIVFTVGPRAADAPLVLAGSLEWGLDWSTFLGGVLGEQASAVAVGVDGSVTVAGATLSADFPTLGGYDDAYAGPLPWSDVFVTQFSASGEMVFSTFLGGSSTTNETARAVAIAPNGIVTVAGVAGAGFPTTAGSLVGKGSSDVFVTRLTASGAGLISSATFGGSSSDLAEAMFVQPSGEVTVTGQTFSSDFPVTPNAYDTAIGAPTPPFVSDAFVARVSADGRSLVFSTYLGGSLFDAGSAVSCDTDGSTIVAGSASAAGDFPVVPGGYSTTPNEIFVARLDPTGTNLKSSTFFGGSGADRVNDVSIGPDGTITLTGSTDSVDLPVTSDAFQPTILPGTQAAFVSRLDPSLSSLVWSTYLGGHSHDEGVCLEVDSAGTVTIAGRTRSGTYPVTAGALQEVKAGGFDFDVVVSRLSRDGKRLLYSTYLGGANDDGGVAANELDLAIGPEGEALVVSQTQSPDFPTQDASDGSIGGGSDAFISKLTMLPTGAAKYGLSTAGCAGKSWMSVTGMPKLGSATFGFQCTNAEKGGEPCFLMVGAGAAAGAVPAKGALLYVNPGLPFVLVPAVVDAFGYFEARAPLPSAPAWAGVAVYSQLFVGGSPCAPNDWAASNALAITLQL